MTMFSNTFQRAPHPAGQPRSVDDIFAEYRTPPPTGGSMTGGPSSTSDGYVDNYGYDKGAGGGAGGTPAPEWTPAQISGVINGVVTGGLGILNTYLQGQNQQSLAAMQQQTQLAMANIQRQMQQSATPAGTAALQAQLVAAQNMLTAIQERQGTGSNTYLYLGIGALALGAVYLFTKGGGKARRNPVVQMPGGRRVYLSPAHARRRARRRGRGY